jgi:hypothetical protein
MAFSIDITTTDAADINGNVRGPLSSLNNSNLYNLTSLQYPEDLGSVNSPRKHWIEFYVNLVESSSYYASASGTNVDQTNDYFTFSGGVGSRGETSFSNLPIAGNFFEYSGFQISPPKKRLTTVIKLYMPDTVNAQYVNAYQEDNINDYSIPMFGQAIMGLGGDVSKFLNNGEKPGLISSLTNPNLLALVREAVGGKVPVDVLLKGRGYAINPQVQLLFKATELRSFQMTFLFTPYSQAEAKAVQDIIRQFKFHAAPEIGGGSGNGQGLFFIPPSTFNLKYIYDGQENTNINKYGECVLENIDIDYATNGWITYPDGSPVQTKMTLSFKEIDIVDKKKIAEGGY